MAQRIRYLRIVVLVLLLFAIAACTGSGANESSASDASSSRPVSALIAVPSLSSSPTSPDLPKPDIEGGGPLSGDPEAVKRMNAVLPDIPSATQISGSGAVSYFRKVASLIPALSPAFNDLGVVSDCAMNYGVVGAKAYITPDLSEAGGIVILSRNQSQQLPQIALRCFASQVIGGGPGAGGFAPCLKTYYFDAIVSGVEDRYFVIVGGTKAGTCEAIANYHARLNPTPF